VLGPLRRRGAQLVGDAEPLGDPAARGPRDRLGADLREASGAVALGLQARIEVRRDGEPQDAVAEERQAGIRIRSPRGPRGVGEDLLAQILGNLVEEGLELLQGVAAA
jgi:hypothetical protein